MSFMLFLQPDSMALTVLAALFFDVACYFFLMIRRRIWSEAHFYTIPVTPRQQQFLPGYVAQLGWRVLTNDADCLVARTGISLSSWGECITIVFAEEGLLFNSRPDLQPITLGRGTVNFTNWLI
jgi:hypothetical protein